jgi:hypothetical protein
MALDASPRKGAFVKTLELDVTFTRDYFTQHFGIGFTPAYFEDVQVRAETDQAVRRALFARFGDLGLGHPDPPPVVQLGFDDTLNVSLMFGVPLRLEAGVSWVETGALALEDLAELQCPPIAATYPHTFFRDQFERAVGLYGSGAVLPPPPHGILETALELRGSEFLEDVLLRPKLAAHFLDVLSEAVIGVKEFWDRQCFGEVRRGLSLGGCSTVTLSPVVVKELLVPRYCRIAAHFHQAFICSCGESTHNLENFAAVEEAKYVRVGWGTDLDRAARVLRGRHLKPSLAVARVASLSPEEVAHDVEHVLQAVEAVEHVSLLLIHAGAETPDANVRRLVETAVAFAEARNIALQDTASCAIRTRRGSPPVNQ